MALGDFLRRLFGGGGAAGEGGAPAAAGPASEYKGYEIQPLVERQGGQWLTAGAIRKEFPDGVKEHRFIRVDTHTSQDDAAAFALVKGKQIIDEQGDMIFRERPPGGG